MLSPCKEHLDGQRRRAPTSAPGSPRLPDTQGTQPSWMKVTVRTGPQYREPMSQVAQRKLNTACQEAGCPQTCSDAGRTARRPSSSVASKCKQRRDLCQIALIIPPRWTVTNLAGSRGRAGEGGDYATRRSPGWSATICPTVAQASTPRRFDGYTNAVLDSGAQVRRGQVDAAHVAAPHSPPTSPPG